MWQKKITLVILLPWLSLSEAWIWGYAAQAEVCFYLFQLDIFSILICRWHGHAVKAMQDKCNHNKKYSSQCIKLAVLYIPQILTLSLDDPKSTIVQSQQIFPCTVLLLVAYQVWQLNLAGLISRQSLLLLQPNQQIRHWFKIQSQHNYVTSTVSI
jgi:hypothetical protein